MSYRMLLAAVALVLVGCGSNEVQTEVVFADSQRPVTGASVTPLLSSPQFDAFAIDPNVAPARTDDNGRFVLDEGSRRDAGVQITIDVGSTPGPVGRLDWRAPFDRSEPPSVLEIPEPLSCELDDQCGASLLPDLVPVIGWNDLPEAVVERLRPTSEGSPTAGLLPAETWFLDQQDDVDLLRFATVAANVGDGPLDIIAGDAEGEVIQTWQRVWTDEWRFTDRLSGEFIFHDDHDHIHFDAFERYRLLDEDGATVASSEKVSFCLRDSVLITGEPAPETGPMLVDTGDCGDRQQIINAGFGDHYHALLEDQWIDISDVPDGRYIVEITVDPLDLILESDETNNTGRFEIDLVRSSR